MHKHDQTNASPPSANWPSSDISWFVGPRLSSRVDRKRVIRVQLNYCQVHINLPVANMTLKLQQCTSKELCLLLYIKGFQAAAFQM